MRGPHTGGTGGEPSRSADAWFSGHVTKRILSSPSVRAEKRSHPCVAEWGSAHRTQGTPDPSARSPHECARDPPVGCASAAGLPLCVRSDGTVAHVAPPAPPRGVAPPGQVTALCAVARVVIGTVNLDFFGFFFYFRRDRRILPAATAWPGPARVARPAGAEVAGFARSRGTTWPGPARARAPSFARKGAASERARVASGVSRALFIVGIRCIVENRA